MPPSLFLQSTTFDYNSGGGGTTGHAPCRSLILGKLWRSSERHEVQKTILREKKISTTGKDKKPVQALMHLKQAYFLSWQWGVPHWMPTRCSCRISTSSSACISSKRRR